MTEDAEERRKFSDSSRSFRFVFFKISLFFYLSTAIIVLDNLIQPVECRSRSGNHRTASEIPYQFQSDDYYKVLGLSKRYVKKATIKKAYRDLALVWHPDKVKNKNDEKEKEYNEKVFVKISEAYNVLSDDKLKNIYDKYGKRGLEMHERGMSPGFGGSSSSSSRSRSSSNRSSSNRSSNSNTRKRSRDDDRRDHHRDRGEGGRTFTFKFNNFHFESDNMNDMGESGWNRPGGYLVLIIIILLILFILLLTLAIAFGTIFFIPIVIFLLWRWRRNKKTRNE
mmetsp:Transcript_3384/g.4924  ORF Transcript_3384/g.4924 Transcript_3384/m.4924 type:complete len:281 (-) Transcript_3384:107-949(-)